MCIPVNLRNKKRKMEQHRKERRTQKLAEKAAKNGKRKRI
jgi:hypothetical protein